MIIGEPILLGGKGETASIFVTGLTETDTVTATKDGKTWNGVWYAKPNPAWRGLPSGYTQVEWIQNSDTSSYFDTGLKSASKYNIYLKASSPSFTTGTNAGVIGGRDAWQDKMYSIHFGGTPYCYEFFYGTSYASSGVLVDSSIHNFSIVGGKLYIDNVMTVDASSQNFESTSNNICLCRASATEENSTTKTYELKAVDTSTNDEYTYVPCYTSSNQIGMYVLETETFIAVTGTFTKGSDVPQYFYGHLISNLNSYGTYTVTATDGTRTATQNVLVDMATEYEIPMKYRTYLYNLGDTCDDVTGGYTISYTESCSQTYITYNSDNMVIGQNSTSISYRHFRVNTVNDIQTGNYTKLYIDADYIGSTSSARIYVTLSNSTSIEFSNGMSGIYSANLGSDIGKLYFENDWSSTRNTMALTVRKVWLE